LDAAACSSDLLSASGAPRRHLEHAATVLAADPNHPWTKLRSQVAGKLGSGITLCLTGGRGNGKTQMGVDLILRVTRQGKPAMFTTAQRVFMAFKGSFDQGSRQTEIQVLDGFRRPALLVIDEVGRRSESEWENRTLFELLNARYGDMTDTVMTCNLDRAALAESLGPSISSRMKEGGGIIECDWESFR
jgi:DNA replication protein DnaC